MMAKYCIIDGFLGEGASNDLLEMAIASEASFKPTKVHKNGKSTIRAKQRLSYMMAAPWKDHKREFRAAVTAHLPRIFAETGMTSFDDPQTEVELVVNREGGHFGRHIDTIIRPEKGSSTRMISAVYYMHRQPKAFTGGQLLLHALIGDESIEIEPLHDRLVAFSSIIPHKVAATMVPGNAFANARFSINCWLHKSLSGAVEG